MNFSQLLVEQSVLDQYIGYKKKIRMSDYKEERIIALQVEFNELINELPFMFKYWTSRKMNKQKALEEYADCLHFILSIGNDFEIKSHEYREPTGNTQDMRKLARGINNMISRLDKTTYPDLIDHFQLLGEKLGFKLPEILEAYHAKNQKNYERQEEGY